MQVPLRLVLLPNDSNSARSEVSLLIFRKINIINSSACNIKAGSACLESAHGPACIDLLQYASLRILLKYGLHEIRQSGSSSSIR